MTNWYHALIIWIFAVLATDMVFNDNIGDRPWLAMAAMLIQFVLVAIGGEITGQVLGTWVFNWRYGTTKDQPNPSPKS